jgi:hypothetical protein
MWFGEALAKGYVSLDDLTGKHVRSHRHMVFQWDTHPVQPEWFTEATIERINVDALRLGNKICLAQVEVELPPGAERPKTPLEQSLEGRTTAPVSEDDGARSPYYPPLKVNPFYTGYAGCPTARDFIQREAERRLETGEVEATQKGMSEFARSLAAWWATEKMKYTPPGPSCEWGAIRKSVALLSARGAALTSCATCSGLPAPRPHEWWPQRPRPPVRLPRSRRPRKRVPGQNILPIRPHISPSKPTVSRPNRRIPRPGMQPRLMAMVVANTGMSAPIIAMANMVVMPLMV